MISFRGLFVAAVTLLLDYVSKTYFIGKLLTPFPTTIDLLPFLKLEPAWNPGVSFGILRDLGIHSPLPFIVLSLVITGALLFWMTKTTSAYLHIAIGFIIGGALGNVLDRILYDAVFDFIALYYNQFTWPNFNIADAAIVGGCFMLIVDGVFLKREAI